MKLTKEILYGMIEEIIQEKWSKSEREDLRVQMPTSLLSDLSFPYYLETRHVSDNDPCTCVRARSASLVFVFEWLSWA